MSPKCLASADSIILVLIICFFSREVGLHEIIRSLSFSVMKERWFCIVRTVFEKMKRYLELISEILVLVIHSKKSHYLNKNYIIFYSTMDTAANLPNSSYIFMKFTRSNLLSYPFPSYLCPLFSRKLYSIFTNQLACYKTFSRFVKFLFSTLPI